MHTFVVAYGTNVFTVQCESLTRAKKMCPDATVHPLATFPNQGLMVDAFKRAMGI